MSGRRNEIPLELAVRFGSRVVERLHVTVDPDKADVMKDLLLDSMSRLHRRDERHLGMYALDAWRVGQDRNPRDPWKTFVFAGDR